jgi:integrase
MTKIEKEVFKFIRNYNTSKGTFWKATIPNGFGGQIRKQGFLEKIDAVDFAVREYTNVLSQNKGIRIASSNLLFRDYSRIWLDSKKRNGLRKSSAMRYEDELTLRLNPYFGTLKIKEIDKQHLRSFIMHEQNSESGSAAIKYSATLFKSIIKQAEIDDLIPASGIATVVLPKHKKSDPRFWDKVQAEFFKNATRDHKLWNLWIFTLYTGLRAGEVAGLRWDCVHIDKSFGNYTGAVEIRRIYNQKSRMIEETTKNGDKRIVPLLPEAREILLSLKKVATGVFVFGGDVPLDSSHFNRQLQTTLKRIPQLPTISFHGLRHSFCSYLDSSGMPRRIVSEIMGHRNINTTARYSHVNDQTLGFEVRRWLENQGQQSSNNLKTVNF